MEGVLESRMHETMVKLLELGENTQKLPYSTKVAIFNKHHSN
jgi:hypothetical protein